MREKIFVVGASGFIGQELVYQLINSRRYDIIAGINSQSILPKSKRERRIDLTIEDEVNDSIHSESPDIIINLAAMSTIWKCEENKDTAYRINVKGVEYLVKATEGLEQRPLFIHFSTDHVFNGFDGRNGSYREEDSAEPGNHYGKTKLESEGIVRNSSLDHLIIRTSLTFGEYRYLHRQDRLNHMIIRSLKNSEFFNIDKNSTISPTCLEYLCRGILFLLKKGVKNETVHIAGSDAVTKFEFAKMIARSLGDKYESMITVSKDATIKNTSLNTEKMRNLGYHRMSIRKALEYYRKSINTDPI